MPSSTEQALSKEVELITLRPDDPIVVICANGRTRSKYVARLLSKLFGLTNVRVAGLHDPHTRELIRRLNQYRLIVATGGEDIVSMIQNDYRYSDKIPVLHVPISEREHAQLHLWHQLEQTQKIHQLLKPIVQTLPIQVISPHS